MMRTSYAVARGVAATTLSMLCLVLSGKTTATNPLVERTEIGSTTRRLDIKEKYLDKLVANKDAAQHWKIVKAEIVAHALKAHVAVKLTVGDIPVQTDGKNNPLIYDEETWDRLTAYALNTGPVTENTFGYYEKPIATTIDAPKDLRTAGTPPLTLGRLLECVDGEPMNKLTNGRCVVLVARVIRFIAGACECGKCGVEDYGAVDKVKPLDAAHRKLFTWDKAGIDYFAATLKRMEDLKAPASDMNEAKSKVPQWTEILKKFAGL